MRILVLLALLFGCSSQFAALPRESVPFRDCGDGFECAELRVPLDHERPHGAEISLALLRRPAEKPRERIGVLVVNPGGPGISAIEYLRAGAAHWGDAFRERFDLIAFDTRGTGSSVALDCRESLSMYLVQDPKPESDAEWAGAVEASRALAQECATKHAELLPFVGTDESARDLDSIRAALGEDQISYLGYSYGTALGASYARRYPKRVRAMVLDGAIDPSFELLVFASEQALAVESALQAYDRVAEREGWNRLEVLDAVLARAERAPIPSKIDERSAEATDVLYGSVEAVVDPSGGFRELAVALGSAQAGEGGPFLRLSDRYFRRGSDGQPGLRVDAQLAVLCADLDRLVSVEAYRAASPEVGRGSPHIGVANLVSFLPCLFWPKPARALEKPRGVDGSRIVVVAGSGDPLTPYAWGERLAQALPGSTLISVDTQTHTAYGRGDACVDEPVKRFLLSGEKLPALLACPQ